MNNLPILGITMGDPSGNGPEISVKALMDGSVSKDRAVRSIFIAGGVTGGTIENCVVSNCVSTRSAGGVANATLAAM